MVYCGHSVFFKLLTFRTYHRNDVILSNCSTNYNYLMCYFDVIVALKYNRQNRGKISFDIFI